MDMTSNPMVKVYRELSGLYSRTPEVEPPDGAEDAAAAIAEAGYWTLMQRIQRDTLGLREMLVHVDIEGDDEDGGPRPVFRPVFPDVCTAKVHPMRPRVPVEVSEWIPDPDNPGRWVRLLTSVVDGVGVYRAFDAGDLDVSLRVIGVEGGLVGDDFPWLVDGAPVLPYVVYHAADSGWLWDAFADQEVVEGTLQLGVLYTFYSHVIRHAAWAQRYGLGVEPAGAVESKNGRSAEVVSDPATLLLLQAQDGFDGQPVVGQWSSPVDPDRVLESVIRYESRLVEMAIGGANVTRRESDIRSGYSLAVSREAQREAQRVFEPLFRRADLAVCNLVSGLMGLPAKGWQIRYHAVARDPVEMKALWDVNAALIEAGLMDPVSAFAELHPGMSRPDAEAALERIAATRRRFKT